MNEAPKNGVWVGLRDCGCCVAVVVDNGDHPKDVDQSKREFLREGLSVVHASWDDWQTKYMPTMMKDCAHRKAARAASESQPDMFSTT